MPRVNVTAGSRSDYGLAAPMLAESMVIKVPSLIFSQGNPFLKDHQRAAIMIIAE